VADGGNIEALGGGQPGLAVLDVLQQRIHLLAAAGDARRTASRALLPASAGSGWSAQSA